MVPFSSLSLGKTVVLIEKAKRLANSGRMVFFIIGFDHMEAKDEISATDHFLYQYLRAQFAKMKNVGLKLTPMWELKSVMDKLMGRNVNIIVDELTFDGDLMSWSDERTRKTDKFFSSVTIPEVKAGVL